MIKSLQQIKILVLFLVLASSFTLSATNYYTVSDGDWDDSNTWSPTKPGKKIESGDSVFILHQINITDNLQIKGILVVQSDGEISGNKKIQVQGTGNLTNAGIISITKQLQIEGEMYNEGNIDARNMEVEGYVNNTGVISIENNRAIEIDGGMIEGGGTLNADEISIDNGGTLSGTSICGTSGNDPVFNLQGGTIDSSSVVMCGMALPIELYLYEVKLKEQIVSVDWITSTELDNDYFVVERSADATNFAEVAIVAGAGSTNVNQYYSVIDDSPLPGVSYYRLKQVDLDGATTYFAVKAVNNGDAGQAKLTVFPNPIVEHDEFYLDLEGFKGSTVQVKIRNLNGMLIYSNEIQIAQTKEKLIVPTNIIRDTGLYVVSVYNGIRWYHQKVSVTK